MNLANKLEVQLNPVMIPGHIYLRFEGRNIETTVDGENLSNEKIASLLHLDPKKLDFKEASSNQFLSGLYSNACLIATKLKKYKRAFQYCDKAINLNENSGEGYINRSYLHLRLKEFVKSLRDAKKAVELYPMSGHAYLTLGIAYKKINKPLKALEYYLKAIEIRPSLFRAYYNSANIYFDQENYYKAINFYTKALDLNTKYYKAYLNRAISLNKIGKKREAINDYDKVLNLQGPMFDVIYEKGLILYQQQKYKLAKKEFMSLKDSFPKKYVSENIKGVIQELNKLLSVKP